MVSWAIILTFCAIQGAIAKIRLWLDCQNRIMEEFVRSKIQSKPQYEEEDSKWKILKGLIKLERNMLNPMSSKADFIEVCHRHDPKLSECAIRNYNNINGHLKVGIPELAIPPLDPHTTLEAEITNGRDGIQIIGKNIVTVGLTSGIMKHLSLEPNNDAPIFQIEIFFPSMFLDGEFELTSTLRVAPFKGMGVIHMNATNLNFHATLTMTLEDIEGERYMKVEDVDMSQTTIEDYDIVLQGTFGNDPNISDLLNKLIRDNKKELKKAMMPFFIKEEEEAMKELVSPVLRSATYDELFPE